MLDVCGHALLAGSVARCLHVDKGKGDYGKDSDCGYVVVCLRCPFGPDPGPVLRAIVQGRGLDLCLRGRSHPLQSRVPGEPAPPIFLQRSLQ